MRYYSDKLKKLYDSEKELKAAEDELAEQEAEKAKLAETRKVRALEVEDAYKKTLEARKEARELIKKADESYNDLLKKFVKDFGSYHMTYTKTDEGYDALSVNDILEDFFGNFPFIW